MTNSSHYGMKKPPLRKTKRRPSGRCKKCKTWRLSLHRDHKIPRWKGGSDAPSNWQYICANCHEDKTREEMRGRVFSKQWRANIAAARRGTKLSTATKKKIGLALTGRIASNEHRAAIAKGQRRAWRRGRKRFNKTRWRHRIAKSLKKYHRRKVK